MAAINFDSQAVKKQAKLLEGAADQINQHFFLVPNHIFLQHLLF